MEGICLKVSQRSHSDPCPNTPSRILMRDRERELSVPTTSTTSKDIANDLTLYGSTVPLRLGGQRCSLPTPLPLPTIRRISCSKDPKDQKEKEQQQQLPPPPPPVATAGTPTVPLSEPLSRNEKIRKSLDNTYRLSLESISEDKATYLFPSIDCSSLESPTSSECMSDYACRSATNPSDPKDTNRTIRTSSSSYMSWIESVNSEYFDNAPGNSERTGEWHNFWKTYNAPRSPYFVAPYLCSGLDDNSAEEFSSRSMCESSGSTQKDVLMYRCGTDKVVLTVEEISEAARCAQKISDILQHALKRAEIDIDDAKLERDKKFNHDETRKNSATFLKVPTTGSSYIDAILTHTGGVAEILKKVINKRRESIMPDPEEPDSRRSSASGWSEVEVVQKK